MFQPNKFRATESGGALIYVFIGVILFALLVFTFSRSMTGPTSTMMDSGQAKIAAAKIMNYASASQKAVDRLIAKGCSESEVSFENDITKYSNNSLSHPIVDAITKCDVFSPNGGKMNVWLVPSQFLDKAPAAGGWKPGHIMYIANRVRPDGTNDLGTSAAEVILVFPFIDLQVCREINNLLGVANPTSSTAPNGKVSSAGALNSGDFTGAGTASYVFNSGCASWDANSHDNHFYYTVMIR